MRFNDQVQKAMDSIQRKEQDASIYLAERLVSNHPAQGIAHFLLAQALTEAQRYAEALESAERACKLDRQNYNSWFLCGSLYRHFKLTELAIPCLKNCIALQPRVSLTHYVLGTCYQEEGQGDKAIESFRNALKLNPARDLKNELRMHLATSLFLSGQNAEAVPLLKRFLADNPIDPSRALMTLVDAEKVQLGTPLAETIDEELQKPDLQDDQKRHLYLARGKMALNSGRHDEAYENWEKAARSNSAEAPPPKDHKGFVNSTKGFYSQSLFASTKDLGHQSQAPIFIAGMPRSGTTLTEQIIGSHSMAVGVGERARWSNLESTFRNHYSSATEYEIIEKIKNARDLSYRAEEILRYLENIVGKDKLRIVEKTPHNFQHLGYFALLFPNAHFIHTRRHPADTFISTFQNNFSVEHQYALDQDEFAAEYAFHEELMNHWKSIFGERIITIEYEKLVSEPEAEARKIISFVGLPWEHQCLKFYESKSMVSTFSTQQVRQPVYMTSIERWRKFERHLGPLFEALEKRKIKYPPGD